MRAKRAGSRCVGAACLVAWRLPCRIVTARHRIGEPRVLQSAAASVRIRGLRRKARRQGRRSRIRGPARGKPGRRSPRMGGGRRTGCHGTEGASYRTVRRAFCLTGFPGRADSRVPSATSRPLERGPGRHPCAPRAELGYLVLIRSLPLGPASAVCALGMLLAGCSAGDRPAGGANAEPAPLVEVARPDSDTGAPLREDGDPAFETALAPLHDVELFARLDGEIVALDVEEGRRVRAGHRLAQIDDRERQATLVEREAQVARAESGWHRAESLHEQKLISDEQWIAARSDWQIAMAQRDRARIDWERCAVRSPISGVIEQRRVQVGQMVKQGDLLFRVGDPDTLRAELLLPEARLGTVRAGQRVRVEPTAGGAARYARVTRVNPLVDPASGTFRVVIDLDNRGSRLPGGVSARVAFDSLAAR